MTATQTRGVPAGAPLVCSRCGRPCRDAEICVTCWDAEIDAPAPPGHGTLTSYTARKCRCSYCRETFNEWKREYKQRRRAGDFVDNRRQQTR